MAAWAAIGPSDEPAITAAASEATAFSASSECRSTIVVCIGGLTALRAAGCINKALVGARSVVNIDTDSMQPRERSETVGAACVSRDTPLGWRCFIGTRGAKMSVKPKKLLPAWHERD